MLTPISVLGTESAADVSGVLHRPIGVAVVDSRVYVLDGGDYRIAVYALDGTFVRSIGRGGSGPGEFGNLGFDGRLEAAPNTLFVVDGAQRRLQAFDWAGHHLGDRKLTGLPASISVAENASFATFKTPALRGIDEAVIHEFDADGRPRRSFGEPFSRIPAVIPDRDARLRLRGLAHSRVAALDDVTVVEAIESWPVVRYYEDGAESAERWLTFDDLGELGALLAKPARWIDEVEAGEIPEDQALFMPVFLDLKPARVARLFAALLNGGALQILDAEARPLAAFKLGGSNAVGRQWPNLRSLAIDAAGEVVCANTVQDSLVYCYRLPDP